jgi:hypothetical protein
MTLKEAFLCIPDEWSIMNVRNATIALAGTLLLALSSVAIAATVNMPAGTPIDGTIQQEINTKTAQDGQRFTMVTGSGSTVYGHISEVARANVGRKAHVKLNFDTIRFGDGSSAPIGASLTSVAQKKQTNYTQAAGQALGGMIVGNILGKAVGTNLGGLVGLAGGALLAVNTSYNIDIPAGSAARITLTQPLVTGHPQAR